MDKYDIDKIFKDGLQHSPSDQYKEEHWKDLESRLPRNGGLNKMIMLSSIFSAVTAACLLIFILWDNNRNTVNVPNEKLLVDLKSEESETKNPMKESEVIQQSDKSSESNIAMQHIMRPIRLTKPVLIDDKTDTLSTSEVVFAHVDTPNQDVSTENNIPLANFSLKDSMTDVVENKVVVNEDIKSLVEAGATEDIKVSSPKLRGTLSLIAALDLTEVRGAGQQKLSENIGLLYTQPITSKFSLSTGVIYSQKKYDSPYSFYKPKTPYGGNHIPTEVGAICDVISIPILANYQILQSKSYTITLSSGLSSYFMLKENYTFQYNGAGYKPYKTNYTVKGENQHFFGVADFSVSFDRKINNKLSLGIRPFMQIPLTGIGYGRTNLQSKGVALNFGFTP